MRIDLDPETFVAELERANQQVLARLQPADTLTPDDPALDRVRLLKMALRNELEATDLAARWMVDTQDAGLRLAFARQVGDESRHYRLIQRRLRDLGVETEEWDPLAEAGYSPLTRYLMELTDPAARVAAGPFTRESIALVKNRQFIELCRAVGDLETARLYEEVIQPDEGTHHQLGRRWLLRLSTTEEARQAAAAAAVRTLELAEELTHLALRKAGIHHAPGC